MRLGLVPYACNPSYLGGWAQEDSSSRPTMANSSWDPISKITRVKWTEGMPQAVECLLCEHQALSSNHSNTQKNSKKNKNCIKNIESVSIQYFFLELNSMNIWIFWKHWLPPVLNEFMSQSYFVFQTIW
jgi:hypothetical protein